MLYIIILFIIIYQFFIFLYFIPEIGDKYKSKKFNLLKMPDNYNPLYDILLISYKVAKIRPDGMCGGEYYPDWTYKKLSPRLNLKYILTYSIDSVLFSISRNKYTPNNPSTYQFNTFFQKPI